MKDIAFYYPGHIWYDIDRIKSMLLFFDASVSLFRNTREVSLRG